MEFMTGVNKKETLEIGDLLTGSYEGKSVKVNGAVHTIRDMGEVAFIVLRKRERTAPVCLRRRKNTV